ncbi:MAG TPA: hypothetical protein PLC53_03850 [Bacilli bacterium]|nr:hypothetical protein [Bacilli bacterium]
MADLRITTRELHALKKFKPSGLNCSSDFYFYDDKTLYKIYTDGIYVNEIEKMNVINMLKCKDIGKAVVPINTIKIEGLRGCVIDGHSMNYIQSSTMFSDFDERIPLSLSIKIKIIRDIFYSLKILHEMGLYIGDIHLDNLIHDRINGYLIDFEGARTLESQRRNYRSYYCLDDLKESSTAIGENQNTDNIKTMVCALSFMLGINLEYFLRENGIEAFIKLINKLSLGDRCKKDIINIFHNLDGECEYFDDTLDDFKGLDVSSVREEIKQI